MILPIDFLFGLHFVLGISTDRYYTFSLDPELYSIDVAWFTDTGHILPFNQHGGWRQ
jgi:hypothetical protein